VPLALAGEQESCEPRDMQRDQQVGSHRQEEQGGESWSFIIGTRVRVTTCYCCQADHLSFPIQQECVPSQSLSTKVESFTVSTCPKQLKLPLRKLFTIPCLAFYRLLRICLGGGGVWGGKE
jgi:hypothetical protein